MKNDTNNKLNAAIGSFIGWGTVVVVVAAITFWQLSRPLPEGVPTVSQASQQAPQKPELTPASPGDAGDAGDAGEALREEAPIAAASTPAPKRISRNPTPTATRPPQQPVTPDTTPERASAEQLKEAIKLTDKGNWQDAEGMLLSILDREPNNESALIELAMINMIDKKDPDSAIPYMQRAIETNTENQTMVSELIFALEKTGRLEEGLDYFNRLKDGGSQSDALQFGIGRTLKLLGRDKEANDAYSQIKSKGSDTVVPPVSGITSIPVPPPPDGTTESSDLAGERLSVVEKLISAGKLEEATALLDQIERDTGGGDRTTVALRQEIKARQ